MKRVCVSCSSLRDVLTPRALLTGAAFAALLAAAPAGAQEGFSESWLGNSINTANWTLWGTPPVKLVTTDSSDGDSRSIDVDGDSWCDSGAYTVGSFDLRRGFTLQFDVNTLADGGDRNDWDQNIRVGIAAMDIPSNAPCASQGEPQNLISLELIAHKAPGTPIDGQRIKVAGQNLTLLNYPNGFEYPSTMDGTWQTYEIDVRVDDVTTNPNVTISRITNTPSKNGKVILATTRVDLTKYRSGAVAFQGRSRGRDGNTPVEDNHNLMLVDNINIAANIDPVTPGTIKIGQGKGCGGEAVTPVTVDGFTGAIDAFGFIVYYNPNKVYFVEAISGSDTADWGIIGGFPLTREAIDPDTGETYLEQLGVARIGGARGNGTAVIDTSDTTPEIVRLKFRCPGPPKPDAICVSTADLTFVRADDTLGTTIELVDDIANFNTVAGQAILGGAAQRGDVNGDCQVTPADAELAFRCYVEFVCPKEASFVAADVSPFPSDGRVTPLDAQTILEIYLGLTQ